MKIAPITPSASIEPETHLDSASPIPVQAKICLSCKLRKSGWFCELSPQPMAAYDAMGSHIVFPIGGILFAQGDEAWSVAVICAGRMKLTCSSREGKTLLVKIAKPGDVLGLSATLSNTPYEVTAQAIERVQIKVFSGSEFLHFVRRNGEGSMHAAESLNSEYQSALNDACRLALSSSVAGKVAHLLLEFAVDNETSQDFRPEIHLPLTHEELASMLGSSRESVTRVLSNFRRTGVVSIKGAKLTILRKEALVIQL